LDERDFVTPVADIGLRGMTFEKPEFLISNSTVAVFTARRLAPLARCHCRYRRGDRLRNISRRWQYCLSDLATVARLSMRRKMSAHADQHLGLAGDLGLRERSGPLHTQALFNCAFYRCPSRAWEGETVTAARR
jgi:hypothetical protein